MATLNIPVRKRRDAEDLRNEIVQAGQKAGEAASLAGQMLFGEDTGSSIGEDLTYGAVPGGSLYQRAMTGTKPGVLDYMDVVPGVGGLAGVGKAATLAVLPDFVKLLERYTNSKLLKKQLDNLPTPVAESWVSSFGDLHSKKLAKHRQKVNPSGTSTFEQKKPATLFTSHPSVRFREPELIDFQGLYTPLDYRVGQLGYYKPMIEIADYGKGSDNTTTVLHEGAHLMDELMGSTDSFSKSGSRSPYFHPDVEHISKSKWIPFITDDKHPLYEGITKKENYDITDWQDLTGNFSPLEYFYAKAHPDLNSDTKAYYWLADDPHGLKHYKPYDDEDYIRDQSAATEGLAQFVESVYDVPALKKTPAMKRLAELAEKDARRKSDYSIDFDPFVKMMEDDIRDNEILKYKFQ